MPIQFRCSSDECQKQMKIELSMEELANLQYQTDEREDHEILIGDDTLNLRKPTGRHQLEWLKHSFPDKNRAVKAMIRSLIVDTEKTTSQKDFPITDEQMKTINEAMEEFDPLVNFSLRVQCPECGKEDQYELNLEELSLHKLKKAQVNLLQNIHRLANHYHWSEQQIIALPPWRRSHYISLIEKEEAQ